MSLYEYHVSPSVNEKKRYFSDAESALAAARNISETQAHHVYVDVYKDGRLLNLWYTVHRGKVERHLVWSKARS